VRYLLNVLNSNAVKYLPTWLPGTGFLTTAKGWREIAQKAAWDPYLWSKRSFVRVPGFSEILRSFNGLMQESGNVLLPNTCATALQATEGRLPTDLEENVVWAACTMMAGGMDTVS
jgi:hypothetical protein